MQRLIYFGMLILFISLVFILLVFTNFATNFSRCSLGGCDESNSFFSLMFGFFVIGSMVVIDSIVALLIVKERAWERSAYKRPGPIHKRESLSSLKQRLSDIKRAKKEAEKQYYKGKFDTETLRKMLSQYDSRIIIIQSKIKSMRKRK